MAAIKLSHISKKFRVYPAPYHKLKEALIREIFRGLGPVYHKEFWALQDVDLEISPGETFGIIGRNGSGKTTLLQIVSGIVQQTSGVVEVNGRISTLLEIGSGFHRDFTGRENVYMNGIIRGISRREMEERFEEIEGFADIGSFIDQPVRTYSNGMFVRLAFATAIHLNPDILIVDEILAVGDEIYRRRCYQKIQELQKMGKTILLVSHSLPIIKSLCTRAMLLDKGRVVQLGDPNLVVHTYHDLVSASEILYGKKQTGQFLENDVLPEDDRFQVPNKGRDRGNLTEYRYGSGDAEVVKFEILDPNGKATSVVDFGVFYTVQIMIKFHKNVEHPVVGMRINTLTGISVSGTTTEIEGVPMEPGMGGSTQIVGFEFCMKLKPGAYMLSVGVSEKGMGGEVIPLDRRMDVMVFKVIGTKKPRGLVDLGFKVRISKKVLENQGLTP